jgi:hypothetical protein
VTSASLLAVMKFVVDEMTFEQIFLEAILVLPLPLDICDGPITLFNEIWTCFHPVRKHQLTVCVNSLL